MALELDQIRTVLSGFLDTAQRDAALQQLTALAAAQTAELPGAAVDLARASRCGFPEVVFGEGKPAELIVEIFRRQHAAGQRAFATRVSEQQMQVVRNALPQVHYHSLARTLMLLEPAAKDAPAEGRPSEPDPEPLVAVVTAGSCDAAVAAEAMETLRWMRVPSRLIEDVGVAGPQRLLKHVAALRRMRVIVCVAGMEAALPSVVGGHVPCPVIGVPTSVGYGASFGGIAAMLSMLTCCASNVVTVNIDAGFRGGYVAGLIATGVSENVAVRSEGI